MTAEQFRVACAMLNYTQKDMANALRLSPTAMSRWANGTVGIPYTAEIVINLMLDAHSGKPLRLPPDLTESLP